MAHKQTPRPGWYSFSHAGLVYVCAYSLRLQLAPTATAARGWRKSTRLAGFARLARLALLRADTETKDVEVKRQQRIVKSLVFGQSAQPQGGPAGVSLYFLRSSCISWLLNRDNSLKISEAIFLEK